MNRRKFIATSSAVLAGSWVAPQLARAQATTPSVPSYLKGYESQYRKDPRAAAVEWHRNAKWGLFVHYALASLRALTAKQALKSKENSGAEWKQLKQFNIDLVSKNICI